MAPPCGCSQEPSGVVMQVQDGNGPVDSAHISIYRADGSAIDTTVGDFGNIGRGAYLVFDHEYIHEFPPGASDLEIRLVARKGTQSGEANVTLRVNAEHRGLRKVSGPDTITIR